MVKKITKSSGTPLKKAKHISRDATPMPSALPRLLTSSPAVAFPGGVPFSEFDVRGNVRVTDIIVGLRNDENSQFLLGAGLLDADDNFIIGYSSVGENAVNYLNFENAETGDSPIIIPIGQDGNIGITIQSKNNAPINLRTQNNYINLNDTDPLYGFTTDSEFTDASDFYTPSALAVKTYVDDATGVLSDLTFITKTDETTDAPNSVALSGLSSGFLSNTTATGVLNPRTITQTANQTTVTNGDGVSGNPVIGLPNTLIAPGTFQATTSINIGGAGATVTSISTDGTLAGNSDALLSTQKAIKTYADSVGGGSVTLTNAGTTSLVNDGVGPALATKGLVVGTGMAAFGTSATDVTINLSVPVTIANGGTNTTSAIGAAGTLATSDGSKYTFTPYTLPSTAGTSGTILRSNGTNFVNSTPTFPNSGTSGKLIRGDGTNYVESTATYPNTITKSSLLYASADDTISEFTASSASVLCTGSLPFATPIWVALASGQVLIGRTGLSPTAATITAGNGISITSASGSVTVATNISYGLIWMNTANWTGVSFAFTNSYQELTSLGTNFTLASANNNFAMTTDGRLKYTGSATSTFIVSATLYVNNGGSFAIQLYKNGSAISGSEAYSNGAGGASVINFPVSSVATNDYFSVFTKRSANSSFSILQVSLSAQSV